MRGTSSEAEERLPVNEMTDRKESAAPRREKIRIPYPVIVEGRYDSLRVDSVVDAPAIVTTDGFGIFRDTEKQALIRALAKKTPVVILTDPDGAGGVIRSKICGMSSAAIPQPVSLIVSCVKILVSTIVTESSPPSSICSMQFLIMFWIASTVQFLSQRMIRSEMSDLNLMFLKSN